MAAKGSAKGKGKGSVARRGSRPGREARLVEPPLHELTRDQLSVFLYVALLPEETRAIVKEQRLTVPGFRPGSLGDVERCDVIADEIRANPAAARHVQALLAKAFRSPPLATLSLDPGAAADLVEMGAGDAALALALWRGLSDPRAEVRQAVTPALDRLAAHYFGPPPEGDAQPGGDGAPERGGAGGEERSLARAEERARRAEEGVRKGEERLEEQRLRSEEQREKLQAALREARARESAAVEDAARAREEATRARAAEARAVEEAASLRTTDAAAEAARARAEARDLAARAGSLEARLERSRLREEELEGELERARVSQAAGRPAPVAGPSAEEVEPESEASWLFPLYTREFYDSLEGWDRRVQRAAFKQAHLLAADHRHPSLRALPLEGLPGYYRVRVATDVRLIYRRGERQNEVEILSLIDREDLDRYVRQAKTRG